MTPERQIIETFFRLPDKDGRDVDFKLNEVQSPLDDESGRSLRIITPKARQRGISTYVVARFLAKCLSQRNRRCVIVSHTAPATQKLLAKADYMLRNLKGGLSAALKRHSIHEIHFEKTDSVLYIGTAGTENVGVGDTITDLHCSEPALWTDPMPLLKGLFNCVPLATGTVYVEGTGNGQGNWYHRTCMRAAEGTGLYKLMFFSWTDAPEYRMPIPAGEEHVLLETLDEEESILYKNKVLDLEQIAWRRLKIEEMDYDLSKFREQYPINLAECFQGKGSSFFHKINFEQTASWKRHPEIPHFWSIHGHPQMGQHYLAGVDVGGGSGNDNTVLEIFSLEEMRQVGEWVTNTLEPHMAAKAHAPILKLFNNAYVNAERNNHGVLYIKELLDTYGHENIHLSKAPRYTVATYGKIADYGTFTSGRLKPEIVGALRKAVIKDMTIHSPLLKNEMDSFIENPKTLQLVAQDGCLDDRVMASGIALYVLPRAAARVGIMRSLDEEQRKAEPFSLEGILQGLDEQYNERMQDQ